MVSKARLSAKSSGGSAGAMTFNAAMDFMRASSSCVRTTPGGRRFTFRLNKAKLDVYSHTRFTIATIAAISLLRSFSHPELFMRITHSATSIRANTQSTTTIAFASADSPSASSSASAMCCNTTEL